MKTLRWASWCGIALVSFGCEKSDRVSRDPAGGNEPATVAASTDVDIASSPPVVATASGVESTTPKSYAEFYEHEPEERARLADLEASQVPPTLEVDHWMNSDPLTLADLRGKIVVLDFWATWCESCLVRVPETNALAEKYQTDLVIIGICNQEGSENMQKIAREHEIKYPIAIDVDGKTVESYRVNGYPDYYLIDREGKLRIADCYNGLVDEAIEAMLAEADL